MSVDDNFYLICKQIADRQMHLDSSLAGLILLFLNIFKLYGDFFIVRLYFSSQIFFIKI